MGRLQGACLASLGAGLAVLDSRRRRHRPPRPPRSAARAQPLSGLAVAGIVALKALGYLVFRGANSQKDLFRRDPTHPRVASLRTLPTERGTKLIVSGWWGIARHINYTGDWMMGWVGGEGAGRARVHCVQVAAGGAGCLRCHGRGRVRPRPAPAGEPPRWCPAACRLAWCLPTGFQSIVPYFYAVSWAGGQGRVGGVVLRAGTQARRWWCCSRPRRLLCLAAMPSPAHAARRACASPCPPLTPALAPASCPTPALRSYTFWRCWCTATGVTTTPAASSTAATGTSSAVSSSTACSR